MRATHDQAGRIAAICLGIGLCFLALGVSACAPAAPPLSGVRIAYVHYTRDLMVAEALHPHINVMRPDGSSEVELYDRGHEPLHWSPDGKKLIFLATRAPGATPDGSGGNSPIVIMNADGSAPKTVVAGDTPSWSPDASRIAYWYNDRAGENYIEVVDTEGAGRQRLTKGQEPVWSPDGTRIAYCIDAFDTGGKDESYVMDADGGNTRELGEGHSPVWSPDGKRIVLERDDGIYIVNVDGSGTRFLAKGPDKRASNFTTPPSWSPDGKTIAFSLPTPNSNSYEIHRVNADGSEEKRLATGEDPTWSPDGRLIAFDDYNYVYLMNSDGSNQRRIADGRNPAWSPP